jgi:hypothetical protein
MRWPCIEGHAKTRRTLSISFPRQFLFLSTVAGKKSTVNRMKLGCRADLRGADDDEALQVVLLCSGARAAVIFSLVVEFRVREHDARGQNDNRIAGNNRLKRQSWCSGAYEMRAQPVSLYLYMYIMLCVMTMLVHATALWRDAQPRRYQALALGGAPTLNKSPRCCTFGTDSPPMCDVKGYPAGADGAAHESLPQSDLITGYR